MGVRDAMAITSAVLEAVLASFMLPVPFVGRQRASLYKTGVTRW
jgi:hypothetical protein